MREKSVFIANDGAEFNDKERCEAYEKISTAINTLSANPDPDLGAITDFVLSEGGEIAMQRAFACLYWSLNVFSDMPEISDLIPERFRGEAANTTKEGSGSGLADQLLAIPADATDEQLGSVLQRFSPDRIALALETLEDSRIPLCVYSRIKKYLFM